MDDVASAFVVVNAGAVGTGVPAAVGMVSGSSTADTALALPVSAGGVVVEAETASGCASPDAAAAVIVTVSDLMYGCATLMGSFR